ncbi:MAG: hypothetical protein AAF736_14505 [Pseudomonadota bacterium]
MKTQLLVLICATWLAGCASSGGEVADASASTTETEKQLIAKQDTESTSDGRRLVCKREKPIGSNRVVKTCRTRDEWNADAQRTQRAMGRNMGRGVGCADCGGDG